MKIIKTWSVLCLCILAYCSPIPISAQYSKDIFLPEKFLPEDILAACVFSDPLRMLTQLKQLPFYKGLLTELATPSLPSFPADREIKVAATLENVWQTFSKLQETRQNSGKPLFHAWSLFHKPIAIALVDVGQFAIIADISDSVELVKNVLETEVVNMIQTENPSVEFHVESYAGIDSYVLSNEQFQIYYTFINNVFVLTLSEKTLRKIITVSQTTFQNTPQDTRVSLFNTTSYRACLNTIVQEKHDVRIYVNIKKFWHTLRPLVRQRCSNSHSTKNSMLLDLLDHYHLTTVFWTLALKDNGGYERMFFSIPRDDDLEHSHSVFPRFLPLLSKMKNEIFTSDRIVPAQVLYYGAFRIDLPKIWQQLRQSIQGSPLTEQRKQFLTWITNIEKSLSISLEHEFFPAFGQEIAVACYDNRVHSRFNRRHPTLEDFPFVLLIQVVKKQALEQTLHKLVPHSQANKKDQSFRDMEIFTFESPGIPMPIPVYMTFMRDFLILSVSRSVLQEIIATTLQGGDLASSRDYQNMSSLFPKQGYARGYIHLKRVLRRIQQIQQRYSSSMQDFSEISFVDRLSGMMWVTTVVNEGFLMESFSPIGGVVVGAAIGWLKGLDLDTHIY